MNRYEKIEQVKETYRANIPKPKPSWPPRVQGAIIFIIAHLYDERLTVSWMKEQCRINGHNFAAVFVHCMGRTPKKFINHHRIETSKKLLLLTSISVSRIAFEVGFSSVSSFDMTFKEKMSCTPSEFRQRNMDS